MARLLSRRWTTPADSKRMADRANGILLDTSAVIAHLRARIDVLALTAPTEPLFLPLVALGELYKGAEKSERSVHNRQLVDDFLQIAVLLFPDSPPRRATPRPPWHWKPEARSSPRMTMRQTVLLPIAGFVPRYRKEWFQRSSSLLTVRRMPNQLSLIVRTLQHTGQPHPVLSSPTSQIPSWIFDRRIRCETS